MHKANFEVKNNYLVVHSKDRDRKLFPRPGHYRIDLLNEIGVAYKDIVSVSLYSIILPDANNITSEPYLLVEIDELSGETFKGTNAALNSAFAFVQMDKPINAGGHINGRVDSCRAIYLDGNQLGLQNLKSLTISIKAQDGNVFDFGLDNGDTADPSKQHVLIFEIKTLQRVFQREPSNMPMPPIK